MPAGSTYTPIATTTLGSAAASYTFSSIPSTYTDLVLIVSGTVSTVGQISLQFNSNTATNYSVTSLYGSGSTAGSGRNSNDTRSVGAFGFFDTSAVSTSIINIMNYSNTTTFKTVIGRGNSTAHYVHAGVSLWRQTSAINEIKAFVDGGHNWSIGTTFTLYGIASA